MLKPSIDDMFSGKESRFPLVIAVAKRAREIVSERNANGVITTDKAVTLATEDFKEHKYVILEPEQND